MTTNQAEGQNPPPEHLALIAEIARLLEERARDEVVALLASDAHPIQTLIDEVNAAHGVNEPRASYPALFGLPVYVLPGAPEGLYMLVKAADWPDDLMRAYPPISPRKERRS